MGILTLCVAALKYIYLCNTGVDIFWIEELQPVACSEYYLDSSNNKIYSYRSQCNCDGPKTHNHSEEYCRFKFGPEDASYVFSGCSQQVLDQYDFSKIDLANDGGFGHPESLEHMFANSDITDNEYINDWDVSRITSFKGTFKKASDFDNDLNKWNVSKGTDFSEMFYQATSFNSDLNDWDVSKSTDFNSMFYQATTFNGNVESWQVQNAKRMDSMFQDASSFNQNLEFWTPKRNELFTSMFQNANAFNSYIDDWEVSEGTHFDGMFQQATSFNSPLNFWDIRNGTSFNSMFALATSFNQPLNNWEFKGDLNAIPFSAMFAFASKFNQSLNSWDLSKVEYAAGISSMFKSATNFEGDISDWDLSNIQDSGYVDSMFHNTPNFQGDLRKWKFTSGVPLDLFNDVNGYNNDFTWMDAWQEYAKPLINDATFPISDVVVQPLEYLDDANTSPCWLSNPLSDSVGFQECDVGDGYQCKSEINTFTDIESAFDDCNSDPDCVGYQVESNGANSGCSLTTDVKEIKTCSAFKVGSTGGLINYCVLDFYELELSAWYQGTTSSTTTTTRIVIIECDHGEYLDEYTNQCITCPAGQYNRASYSNRKYQCVPHQDCSGEGQHILIDGGVDHQNLCLQIGTQTDHCNSSFFHPSLSDVLENLHSDYLTRSSAIIKTTNFDMPENDQLFATDVINLLNPDYSDEERQGYLNSILENYLKNSSLHVNDTYWQSTHHLIACIEYSEECGKAGDLRYEESSATSSTDRDCQFCNVISPENPTAAGNEPNCPSVNRPLVHAECTMPANIVKRATLQQGYNVDKTYGSIGCCRLEMSGDLRYDEITYETLFDNRFVINEFFTTIYEITNEADCSSFDNFTYASTTTTTRTTTTITATTRTTIAPYRILDEDTQALSGRNLTVAIAATALGFFVVISAILSYSRNRSQKQPDVRQEYADPMSSKPLVP